MNVDRELRRETGAQRPTVHEPDSETTIPAHLLSHALGTPLHAIEGYTALLLDGAFGPLSPDVRSCIKDLRLASIRLETLAILCQAARLAEPAGPAGVGEQAPLGVPLAMSGLSPSAEPGSSPRADETCLSVLMETAVTRHQGILRWTSQGLRLPLSPTQDLRRWRDLASSLGSFVACGLAERLDLELTQVDCPLGQGANHLEEPVGRVTLTIHGLPPADRRIAEGCLERLLLDRLIGCLGTVTRPAAHSLVLTVAGEHQQRGSGTASLEQG
ncbi:MAG: hypothetical protein ACFB6S_05455 [Geminicoccaceae bacterium]